VLPFLVLTLVVFVWASNTIVSKVALREATPVLLALCRFTIATVVFYLPVFLVMRRLGPPLRRGDWLRLAAIGILGSSSSVLLFTIGVSTTPATYAGFILMTTPIWTALLAWLFLRERLGRVRSIGMLVAFAGAVFLVTQGEVEAFDSSVLVGSGFLLLAQISWSGYTLMSKPLLARRSPLLVLAASHLIAVFALWVASGLLGVWGQIGELADWSLSTWLAVAYMVVFVSAASQALYVYGLRAIPASQAISFMYLQPVFTVVLAGLALGERPGPLTVAFGALIFLGLWLVNHPAARRTAAETPLDRGLDA
jgi:drug/metabolite transporter (DMT)-like permease